MSKESSKKFWNKEYAVPKHLTLSDEPSEDLVTFARWADRNSEWPPFPQGGMVVDIGCGNGRNLIAVCKSGNMKGYGVDISDVAIEQAKKASKELLTPIEWRVGDLSDPIPLPDQSVDVVLDMMSSHHLDKAGRTALIQEIVRVMKPFGWFFFKTHVKEGDLHAKRLLKDHPGKEENTYIHPRMGTPEYIWTEDEIHKAFSTYFKIHKVNKSYRHVTKDGKAHKRRTISAYMERLRD